MLLHYGKIGNFFTYSQILPHWPSFPLFTAVKIMSAFLHHCPFLKSTPGPSLRNVVAYFGLANRCPIIVRQISVKANQSSEEIGNAVIFVFSKLYYCKVFCNGYNMTKKIIWKLNKLSIDVWLDNIWPRYNYLKIWNLRVQNNLNIEKIAFKVVQMKSLTMHITNEKLSLDIFTVGIL